MQNSSSQRIIHCHAFSKILFDELQTHFSSIQASFEPQKNDDSKGVAWLCCATPQTADLLRESLILSMDKLISPALLQQTGSSRLVYKLTPESLLARIRLDREMARTMEERLYGTEAFSANDIHGPGSSYWKRTKEVAEKTEGLSSQEQSQMHPTYVAVAGERIYSLAAAGNGTDVGISEDQARQMCRAFAANALEMYLASEHRGLPSLLGINSSAGKGIA